MLNPHPPLSGFPPVIAVVLLLFEIARLRFKSLDASAARVFLNVLLIVFTAVTYFSGFFGRDAADVDGSAVAVHEAAIAAHEGFARLALILCSTQILFLLMRELTVNKSGSSKRVAAGLYLFNTVLLAALLLYTALLGGVLVFDLGLGVS